MRLTQNLKTQLTQYCSMVLLFEKLLCGIHCFTISICKEKVPNAYKELIRKIMTSEYEKLLLITSLQNKVTSNCNH